MNKPYIFFSGNTVVRGGNVVTVRGEFFDEIKKATLSDGKKTAEVTLYQLNKQSFKFVIPADFSEGLYSLSLAGDYGEVTREINTPVVRWIQSDEGKTATPDGWVRVQGECLRVREDCQPYAVIEGNGKKIVLSPEKIYDDYSVKFNLSALEDGEYDFTYNNGLAFAEKVTLTVAPSPEEKWNKTVYNALDYGFATDKIGDCTEAFTKLLELVGKNGGGIIYIPHGKYHMTGTFRVPTGTVIRGDGYKRTQLFWTDEWYEFDEDHHWMPTKTPYYMFFLEGECAFEDIDFEGRKLGNMFRNQKTDKTNNIRFDRIRVQANPLTGNEMHIRCGDDKWRARSATMKEHFMCRNDLFTVSGVNIKVRDSVFNWGGRPFGDSEGSECYLMQRCVFGDCTAIDDWMPLGQHNGAIIEDNEFRHWTMGASGKNFYFARNKILNVEDNNREAFTTDVALGMSYYGTDVKKDGCRFTFPEGTNMENVREGKTLVILSGKGAGQLREVTAVDGYTVTVESPFDVEPDDSSVMIVNHTFRNFYFIDLQVHNSGSIQFYTAQANTVVDRVKFTHSASIKGWGQFVYGTMSENWYSTFQNCEYDDVNYYHMDGWYMAPTLPGNSFMCAFGEGDETSNICCTMRNNHFVDDSIINIRAGKVMRALEDCVIENNEFNDCKCAIYVEHKAQRIFAYNNTYNNVGKVAEFTDPATEEATIFA